MANIQAGDTGAPGILVFNAPLYGALMAAMPPDPTDAAWQPLLATYWLTAMLASVVVPGTVVDPATWTISVVDVATLPTAAASVPTASVAFAKLTSGFYAAKKDSDPKPPKGIAKAYHEAFLELQFLCIGIALVGIVPTPVPLLKAAK